ncbi:Methyltransferase domain-containing protein [Streptomyces sp. DvalAA-14]|uniref:class I SAM-dependent DNA methyltransferase n=1 Tax=unclassified Streptomyces TaxID=2593676 RepID=UPI00081B3C26|nr:MULTISPECIES: class I SAM-dependent methyltransferase [unclassified Streptomyces]MYS23365.1 methyltransferase domain-containing protein [Streptomyces sp. SID4948]SCE32239.1 Methyltransferase domain-containing protein [Streptomyces sp. DvalAA-14]
MTEAEYLHTTRTVYDAVAVDYEKLLRDELDDKPLDRAMLAAFAELVRAAGLGPVADLGCGPGRVTAHLSSLGVDVFGVDLSAEMIAVARRRHPGLRFEQGSMTALDLADNTLGGALVWYSTVHTPPELLPKVFAECHRVLAPGAPLLLAFKVGDLRRPLGQAYGHELPLTLDVYWLAPDHLAALLNESGLPVDARLIREPDASEKPRQGQQGFFLTHKPTES